MPTMRSYHIFRPERALEPESRWRSSWDGGKSRILALKDHPAVQMMGIMDEDGNIDLDRLYNAARTRVDGKKIPWNIPVIGELKFDVNDVDRLYKYIQEA